MTTTRLIQPQQYMIRDVQPGDIDAIIRLSSHLDSVNFPHHQPTLETLISRSNQSFDGQTLDPTERLYMFVLANTTTGEVVGTSRIVAQHGRPEEPHVFFDVVPDERYSSTLNRLFSHTTLRLGFSYRGPTEIGALVLDPNYRAQGLGQMLSLCRFLFIAAFRDRFQDNVIAELMPPLTTDGKSKLWEYIGKRFTGLTYKEADRLSHTNKEFIYSLFPQTPLYASMLPTEVAELIGQVGEHSRSAQSILEKIGFRYSGQIDPFDGGPHFIASTDTISPIKAAQNLVLGDGELSTNEIEISNTYIIGTTASNRTSNFRAVTGPAQISTTGEEVFLTREAQTILSLSSGDSVWLAPYINQRAKETCRQAVRHSSSQ
ncbi:MAG: arginine N-succinyltransferase [Myxococcales bacterium]|nr:arginine N-succinyltransferase [Myxococcales bacterium]